VVLKSVGPVAPVRLSKSPNHDENDECSRPIDRRSRVNGNDGEDQQVPQIVLRGHNLVENDEAPRLHDQAHPEIVVENAPRGNDAQPLRQKGQDRDGGHFWLVKQLVDQVEVDRVIVSVVLPHEVVQVRLVQILVAVDKVEASRKRDECEGGDESERETVFREEAFLAVYGGERLLLLQFLVVHVDPEIQRERIDNWVNLEVDCKAVPETRHDILALVQVVKSEEN